MDIVSPYQKMIDFNNHFKDTKRVYRAMQDHYIATNNGSPVFCPSVTLYNLSPVFLMERERGGWGNKLVDSKDDRQISLLTYFWGMFLFGTWRNTLGIYRLDEDVFADVISSPIPLDTPSMIFKRLPDWSVYMEIPNDTVMMNLTGTTTFVDGFWAQLDYDYAIDQKNPRLVLSIFLDLRGKSNSIYDTRQPIRLLLDKDMTVSDAFETIFKENHGDFKDNHADAARFIMITTKNLLMNLLSMLLWLCAEEPDISNMKGEPVSRDDIKKSGNQINKKTGRFVPPSTPIIRLLGSRLGGEVRDYKQWVRKGKTEGAGRLTYKVRPHIRRGHFHGYWKGTGQDKQFEVKWRYACFVNSKAGA